MIFTPSLHPPEPSQPQVIERETPLTYVVEIARAYFIIIVMGRVPPAHSCEQGVRTEMNAAVHHEQQ